MSAGEGLTSDLARAGRALTRVSARLIAARAGIEKQRVRDFEKGIGGLDADEQGRLRAALESYGVVFIPDDDAGGYGVRQKYNDSKTRRLHTWEGEGGSAADDNA